MKREVWKGRYQRELARQETRQTLTSSAVGGVPTRLHAQAYERRYSTLVKGGFMWWEAYWLAMGTINGTRIKEARRQRAGERELFKEKYGADWYKEFQKAVKQKYVSKGWFTQDGRRIVPQKMLDEIETDDKAETPQPKKRQSRTDRNHHAHKQLQPPDERGEKKYPKGRHYK